MAPLIVETRRKIANVVGNCRKIIKVFRNCQLLTEISEVVDGGGSENLKCCRPEKFLVCRKKFSVCRKNTALGLPKNMGPTAPLYTANSKKIVLQKP